MSKDKNLIDKVCRELNKINSAVQVCLLMKGNIVAGRITVRRTEYVVHVALSIYASDAYGLPILGYKRMTGWGYDRMNTGIAEILSYKREILLEKYNVKLSTPDWDIMNTCRRILKTRGSTSFTLFRRHPL